MKASIIAVALIGSFLVAVAARAEEANGLSSVLVAGDDWQVVADNIGFADGASADADGNFYFSDLHKPVGIYRITPDGKKEKVADAGMSGTKMGPDGRLYACGGGKVASFDLATGKETVIADNLKPNDIAVDHRGHIYITETGKKQVTFIDVKTGKATAADVGISKPNGIGFTPDQNTLLVSDYGGMNVWSFHVAEDGTLSDKKPAMTMRAPEKKPDVAGGDGMTVDAAGRAYVTTALGLQIFDADGKLLGVLPKPQEGALTNAAIAGKDLDQLYLTCGTKVFRRKIQAKAALVYLAPPGASEKK
jgi:sugar lactone lactonase YvrE